VTLYFPHRDRPVLVRERRFVPKQDQPPEVVLLGELVRGPEAEQARPLVEGEAVPEAWLSMAGAEGGVLEVVIHPEAAAALAQLGAPGVYAIVNTLAGLDRVRRVKFHVTGAAGPVRAGGVDITQPLAPEWSMVELVSPPTVPGDCRSVAPAGEAIAYLREATSIVFIPYGEGLNRGAWIRDESEVAGLVAVLAGAEVAPPAEARGLLPDVTLLLYTPSGIWPVDWISGTAYFRLWHDSRSTVLRAEADCVPLVAEAANRALAAGCPVSAVVHRFPDVAIGRQRGRVWAIDGGRVWKVGETVKVLWRVLGGDGSAEVTASFWGWTPVASIGATEADEPVEERQESGGFIRLSGPVQDPDPLPTLRTYASNVRIPRPGCWTLTFRSGDVEEQITVSVRP
jgi:hypothetical protein